MILPVSFMPSSPVNLLCVLDAEEAPDTPCAGTHQRPASPSNDFIAVMASMSLDEPDELPSRGRPGPKVFVMALVETQSEQPEPDERKAQKHESPVSVALAFSAPAARNQFQAHASRLEQLGALQGFNRGFDAFGKGEGKYQDGSERRSARVAARLLTQSSTTRGTKEHRVYIAWVAGHKRNATARPPAINVVNTR